MTCWKKIAAALLIVVAAGVPGGALAGSTGAGHYWGLDAGTGGSGGGTEFSSTLHYNDAALAGQVNLAKKNLLLGTNISVYAIGSQNIVSVTGSNNNVSADQTSSNSGDVSNNGSVSGQ